MYLNIYIYIYIYIYTHMFFMCIYVYMYICTYVYTHEKHICVYRYIFRYICIPPCMPSLTPLGSRFFTVCIRIANQKVRNLSQCGPQEMSSFIELTLGHLGSYSQALQKAECCFFFYTGTSRSK